jgi:membrane-associated protease RseP (regulator of RpoE activity)
VNSREKLEASYSSSVRGQGTPCPYSPPSTVHRLLEPDRLPRFRTGEPLPPPPEEYRGLLADERAKHRDRYWLHILLFVVTLGSTIWAGGLWAGRVALWERTGWALYLDPVFFADGLLYAIPFLLFLTAHEFGHYFAARRHRVDVSLPYYIPVPPFIPIPHIGTFGAVIRIRERIQRTRQLFDIGAAGPLAGFVVALGVLVYAIVTLPPPTYVMGLGADHEAIQQHVLQHGTFPTEPSTDEFGLGPIAVGNTLLFLILRVFVTDMPPAWELYHYPALFAGWLALFFTALNLLPVGQLDGGHVTHALFGRRRHAWIARSTVLALLFSGGLGAVTDMGMAAQLTAVEYGRPAWWGLAIVWVSVLLILRWLSGKLFLDRYWKLVTFVALAAAVAVADMSGVVADTVAWSGWLLWSILIIFVIKLDHPPVMRAEPLSPMRKALGIVSLIIFLLCFSPRPFYMAM